jgi:hypothetical protein
MAAADASFNMVMLSISLGFKNTSGFLGVVLPSTPLADPKELP